MALGSIREIIPDFSRTSAVLADGAGLSFILMHQLLMFSVLFAVKWDSDYARVDTKFSKLFLDLLELYGRSWNSRDFFDKLFEEREPASSYP